MYRRSELKRLAEAYLAATGITANALSNRISCQSNNRLIGRLLDGHGIGGRSIEAASDFFAREWPHDVAWPNGIARNGLTREAAE
jgi:hypothetical protein